MSPTPPPTHTHQKRLQLYWNPLDCFAQKHYQAVVIVYVDEQHNLGFDC